MNIHETETSSELLTESGAQAYITASILVLGQEQAKSGSEPIVPGLKAKVIIGTKGQGAVAHGRMSIDDRDEFGDDIRYEVGETGDVIKYPKDRTNPSRTEAYQTIKYIPDISDPVINRHATRLGKPTDKNAHYLAIGSEGSIKDTAAAANYVTMVTDFRAVLMTKLAAAGRQDLIGEITQQAEDLERRNKKAVSAGPLGRMVTRVRDRRN